MVAASHNMSGMTKAYPMSVALDTLGQRTTRLLTLATVGEGITHIP